MAEQDDRADGPRGLPLRALEEHLRSTLPGLVRGPLSATLVAGGRSNLTYLLTDGHDRWVLRRPPLGHVLETAHDMGREHRLLGALAPTDVPVPRPLLLAGARTGVAHAEPPWWRAGEVVLTGRVLGSAGLRLPALDPESALLLELTGRQRDGSRAVTKKAEKPA